VAYTYVYAKWVDDLKETMQRKAKIFMNNRSQAVRLPKEFQFTGKEVFIRKEGSDVVLSPRPSDWSSYLADAPVASPTFMEGVETSRCRSVSRNAALHVGHDTCSYIMKRSNDAVLKRLQQVPVGDVCISVITKSQLLFGVELSPRRPAK